MSAPERIWAERKTLSGDPVENGYWEARPLYRHTMAEYLRADLCTPTDERVKALEAENARLRDERDDAIDTLNAWFDRRKLAHEAIDETVLNAARGYLRTSRSGGMDKETSDMIEGVIEDMARMSVFADLFARAALRDIEGGK